MARVAVRADRLGKQYTIGVRPQRYYALRDTLASGVRRSLEAVRFLGASPDRAQEARHLFWALRDVSFDIAPGEVVGIIGSNGAGKSTLLKILSRITDPTTGRAEIRGRVGSLLEVGTGFHPELTGRENVYLNGAILGMRKSDIAKLFDQIVAFAEVERFIDTPVKHYSSGMYLRLAFAVAAHLEPEILVVDEVLAVGDAAFQKKCTGKMGSVARTGRTVLFVSHNMAAVRALCSRVIVLDRGRIGEDSRDVSGAIAAYAGARHSSARWERDVADRQADARMVFSSLECRLQGDQPDHVLELVGELTSLQTHPPAFLAFDIVDAASAPLMQALPRPEPFIPYSPEARRFTVRIVLPPLVPGTYQVDAWVGSHYSDTLDFVASAVTFTVATSPTPGRSFPHSPDHGFVVPPSTVSIDVAQREVACTG